MMFKFNKTIRRPLLAVTVTSLVALGFAVNATAGLEKVEAKKSGSAKGKTKPTEINSMAKIPVDKVATNEFKCWQEGRLIFKRSGVDFGAAKLPGATRIDTGKKSLQVLDLKQGVCILDQSR